MDRGWFGPSLKVKELNTSDSYACTRTDSEYPGSGHPVQDKSPTVLALRPASRLLESALDGLIVYFSWKCTNYSSLLPIKKTLCWQANTNILCRFNVEIL